jgi:hypothetical protein
MSEFNNLPIDVQRARDMRIPWIANEAFHYIQGIIKPEWSVFEWGAGSSTMYWLDHCQSVVTVEHDPKWAMLAPGTVELIRPEGTTDASPADPYGFASYDSQDKYERYCKEIDRYTGFDMICIDGRARPSCLWLAIPHVMDGGYLMLDNSDRDYYQKAIELVPSWWEFFRAVDMDTAGLERVTTTIWHRTSPSSIKKVIDY